MFTQNSGSGSAGSSMSECRWWTGTSRVKAWDVRTGRDEGIIIWRNNPPHPTQLATTPMTDGRQKNRVANKKKFVKNYEKLRAWRQQIWLISF